MSHTQQDNTQNNTNPASETHLPDITRVLLDTLVFEAIQVCEKEQSCRDKGGERQRQKFQYRSYNLHPEALFQPISVAKRACGFAFVRNLNLLSSRTKPQVNHAQARRCLRTCTRRGKICLDLEPPPSLATSRLLAVSHTLPGHSGQGA